MTSYRLKTSYRLTRNQIIRQLTGLVPIQKAATRQQATTMPICGGNEKSNPAIEADLKKSREASKKDIKGMHTNFLLKYSLAFGCW